LIFYIYKFGIRSVFCLLKKLLAFNSAIPAGLIVIKYIYQ